jgi:hypothetical protein
MAHQGQTTSETKSMRMCVDIIQPKSEGSAQSTPLDHG